jgi:outer membrane protein
MKNLSLVLNLVLLLAVAFLYYKVYSDKGSKVVMSSAEKKNATIVYVDSDSLFDNYPLMTTLEKAFNNKRDSLDRVLSAQDKALKNEYASFEERAATMSREQQENEYKGFMQKQQALEQLRDQLLKKLGDEQTVMQDSIHNSLISFMREYNKSKGYQYILSYTRGSGILYANDSLNVTNEVVKGLKETK